MSSHGLSPWHYHRTACKQISSRPMAPRGPNASLSAWHGGDWNRGQEHEDASAPQSSGPSLVSRASPVRFGSWREKLTASKSGPQYLNDQNYSVCPEMLPGRPSRPGEFSPESLTEPDVTLSRHPTARKATGRRIKIMRFRANYVSTSASGGDYYQAMFAAEEDTNDSDSPYLISNGNSKTQRMIRATSKRIIENTAVISLCAESSLRRRACWLSSTVRATIRSA
jgi:hypothetical protein